ncbi:MAG: hypothetical protein Q7J10_01225 [Methanosarcinaceae archaeon]|nr:hypothetical protein [Methanosarcinaceae archaeon]
MGIEDKWVNNIHQSEENAITTNLFDVVINLRNDAVKEYNGHSITADLLDITMDTHGTEVTEELVHMCKQNDINLFDMLVELHGAEIAKELIYTHGKMKGLDFGKNIGKCKNPHSAIKQINAHIQSGYDIKIDNDALSNEQDDLHLCKINSEYKSITYTQEKTSPENGSTKNLRNNKKTVLLNPLYINTQGFIEGALSFMTGMQANIATESNEHKIYFKKSKKYFFGLF